MSEFVIVEASYENLAAIVAFQVEMAKETEALSLNQETVTKGVKAIFDDPGKGTYYLVKTGENEIVGCLLTTFEWSEWRNGTVLWIQSVYIKRMFRNMGLFKKMYHHLKAKVTETEELKGIRLYVDKSNNNAQEVYEKIGMDGHHYQLFEWLK